MRFACRGLDVNPRIVPVPLQGSPQSVFARLQPRRLSVLLESSKAMPGLSGWSYVAGPALATLETRGDTTELRRVDAPPTAEPIGRWPHPFDALRDVLAQLASPAAEAPPRPDGLAFAGGLAGHLGYDLARHVERLPTLARADPPLPDLRLLVCDHVLAFDHAHGQWFLCTLALPWGDPAQRQARWADTLAQAGDASRDDANGGTFEAGPLASRTPPSVYLQQVQRVLDYVAAGDIFQANLSHRLEGPFEGDAFALYRRLTAANPAPFSAYLEGDGFAIASVSPERFLKLAGRDVTARPIKGTRARGTDASQDALAHSELQASVKDRAENLMIVDLMRNDLGRVAQVGSVRASPLFELEAHPSVWQMVSTVSARLRDDASVADLLRACWPPGSMTGAPKVRAMEIIEELEPVRRGPYAGAIGYFDAAGGMDLSVVIRTAVVAGGRVMVQVGGAVVADSQPQAELAETFAKGQRLVEVLTGDALREL
jgi:para-aminobenzoate synthetase component 1